MRSVQLGAKIMSKVNRTRFAGHRTKCSVGFIIQYSDWSFPGEFLCIPGSEPFCITPSSFIQTDHSMSVYSR